MMQATGISHGIKAGAVRLALSSIAALAVLVGVLVMTTTVRASPLIGTIDIASDLKGIETESALFFETGGFRSFAKFRSHRGRSLRGRQFNGFRSFRGRDLRSFRSPHGHRKPFFGFHQNRYGRFR